MAAIPALLDSCVLYPARLRDLLLSLAAAGLFRPIWSNSIHEEWMTNVLANRPDLSKTQLEATRSAMDRAFPAAMVSGFERLIPSLNLPDADDRHVLATAVYARAELIITVNLNDFPAAALRPYNIVAAHPDSFVDYLFDLNEAEAISAIAGMRSRLRAPAMTPDDFIDSLAQVGMPLTVSRLRRHANRI
ncbi:MAG: PIN domain-containing protein [Acidobacteriaceae bacterium]|nr:PIN domain-containing protein [Acidobacteriaceae bacterium]